MQVIWTSLATIVLIAVAAGCSLLPAPSTPSPGEAVREELVMVYLDAIERRDAAAIEAMVSPAVDATAEIAQVLDVFGGVKLHDVRATWLDEFDGIFVVATVTGTSEEGGRYEIHVPMVRSNGRYYLALGSMRLGPGNEASPESPSP